MNQMLNDLLKDNGDFKSNVQQSMLDTAAIVIAEPQETANHINRAVLAKCIMKSPDMATDLFLAEILQAVFTNIPEQPDIDTITAQVWNSVSNQF